MSILRYEDVDWSIPCLVVNQKIYINLIYFFAELGMKSPIKDVYGYIRNRWNGIEYGYERVRSIGDFIKDITYTKAYPVINFSNYHLETADLKDPYCNDLLDFGVSCKAKFIVSSDLLYKYIKSKYPNASLICSDIKSLYEMEKGKEFEFYQSLYDKYDQITLSSEYVKNGFINDVENYSDISKFEVVVNNTCLSNCDLFKYENESVENFEMHKGEYIDLSNKCYKNNMPIKDGIGKTLILSRKELDNLVINVGIKKLKLLGFNKPLLFYPDVISSYIFDPIGDFQHVSFDFDKVVMER